MRSENVGSGGGRAWNAHPERVNGAHSVVRGCGGTGSADTDQTERLVALTARTADGGGRLLAPVMAHWITKRPPGDPSVRGLTTARPTRKTVAEMDLVVFLPLLIILGAFMFFASRRQKKAMQATIDLHESLTVGDRIHTTSGLQATIAGIGDDTVDLEIAPGVVTTWMKLAVRDRVNADDDDFDDDEDDIDETPEASSSPSEITESGAVIESDRQTKD
jgi:preprotein translocase subunit YajC